MVACHLSKIQLERALFPARKSLWDLRVEQSIFGRLSMNTGHPSPCTDFDFEFGEWVVHHRRSTARLCGCTEWTEFRGRSPTRPILGGFGNLEDHELSLPQGLYRAVVIRSRDPAACQWAIWWLDARQPLSLDVPVIGRFAAGTGLFFADDILDGRKIKVRFAWKTRTPDTPRWEQAFSADDGATWETIWVMQFERA